MWICAQAGFTPADPPSLDGSSDQPQRAKALAALASHLAKLPRPVLYSLWDETLPILARRTRRDLLTDLGALAPVIVALGGAKALAETARAIQDAARWWP